MSLYLSEMLDDEKYFVCCRCGVSTNLKDSGITIDDVIFSWDFDTDEESNKYLKKMSTKDILIVIYIRSK